MKQLELGLGLLRRVAPVVRSFTPHTHTMADQDVSKLGIASVLLKAGMFRVCVVDPLHTDPCC
jgi:hypothetical protein